MSASQKVAKKSASADPGNPYLWILVYIFMGTIAGFVSVWIVPIHWLGSPTMRLANLAVTPIVLGLVFEWLGRWRSKKHKSEYVVDQFSYGFTFALTMGMIRYFAIG
ncbi:hypothetical protein [Rubripirellula reticaptiva]|uniref:Uncharacterized protein n=1 Tax=Rubripirellula reticaptiva TaxID=2528013 RepID=A0A5C6FCV2_9BACT|nr:hypothetical protein [Rubripirellula reticaptiva]TWU58134.1 hypothetical protein Poly59_10430 [Rubripirellula reticaptiva]